MDHLHSLNPSQREAVLTLSGPLLVLAGAGTGKTRVITFRMAELIRNGVAPNRILSVTFTNKAAREMQERITALLGRGAKRRKPVISTFHALCVKILRQDIEALGYPSRFAIYDRGDQESAARTALRDIRLGDQALRPGDLLSRISRWKMAGVLPNRAAEFVDNDQDLLAALAYRKYQKALRSRGAVDFDDLLLVTKQLFDEHPAVLAKYQQIFEHVQIDEYQDTNSTQFELVSALVAQHRNLCVVGDDDQSIYGWRGAEVEHILGFHRHFPGARVVRLQDNYRCTDRILEVANRLVRHNRDRHEKTLVAHKRGGSNVRFVEYQDENQEAEQVVREIRYLSTELNVPLRNFAILFRTNEQPRPFEAELRRQRVPYVLIGGQSFFDRREIRDLLAYIKTITLPRDEVSLLRIINTPARGIGDSSIEKLLKLAVSRGQSLWDVLGHGVEDCGVTAKTKAAIRAFRDLVERYRRLAETSTRDLAGLVENLIHEIGYESEIERQYKTEEQRSVRRNMVESLIESVRVYAERAAEPSFDGFLEEAALMGRDEETDREGQAAENAVKLMTLHCAKGLEFPNVYLVGLEEGLLPHHKSLGGSEAAVAEERRLAYVGITRAMDHLTITRAASRMKWGKRRPSLPSRFLFEMRETAADLDDDLDLSTISVDLGSDV